MSPFTYADSLKTPILMIHGAKDSNAGTYTVQSERMFAALRATGGTARLVLLPSEDHLYLARESVGHALWEMARWMDLYVKPPKSATP
jgi:dipeptidyl aminopeptidase/acylaminoacyl peptidase